MTETVALLQSHVVKNKLHSVTLTMTKTKKNLVQKQLTTNPTWVNWRILLVQSFTARMPLLMATSTLD